MNILLPSFQIKKFYHWKKLSSSSPIFGTKIMRDIVLRNDDDFVMPNPRIEFFKKIPLYALPTLWKNSGNLKYYDIKVTFRRVLRDQLFEEIELN